LDDSPFLDGLFTRWGHKSTLSAQDKRALADLPWSQRTVGREAYLVREGEPTSVCTLLLSGLAFRQKLVSDGSRQIISFHVPSEFLDLQNAMFNVADHNVQALTRATVAQISKTALLQLMEQRVDLRRAIWLDTLLESSVAREWVVNVGRRDARARIAHLLCELAMRMKLAGISDGEGYDFPLTQEQIADATGLTAVHTNRTLQALRRDGLISLGASKLVILDWDGLCEAGDFNERYLHHAA
jgi:CRP-like cAMP-binding protein